MMKTKVRITERAEWGEKLVEVIHSYNIGLFAVQLKELTNKDMIELEAQGKDEERQEEEEVSEELEFTQCQLLCASCCAVLLCFSRYCKIKNILFILCVCFYVLFVWKLLYTQYSTVLYNWLH